MCISTDECMGMYVLGLTIFTCIAYKFCIITYYITFNAHMNSLYFVYTCMCICYTYENMLNSTLFLINANQVKLF